MRQISSALTILILLFACDDGDVVSPAPAETATVESALDYGTVSFLKVTDKDGLIPDDFPAGHPMNFTITVDLEEGFEHRLSDLVLSVGLVEAVETEAEQADAVTCFLMELSEDSAEFRIDEANRQITFVGHTVVPSECAEELRGGETRTMNVWVSINAPTDDEVPDDADVAIEDANVQFFTRFEEDFGSATNRNGACVSEDGEGNPVSSCVLDLVVKGSPGFNLEVSTLDLESTLFVVSDDVCTADIDFSEPGLEASVGVSVWGDDPHPKSGRDHSLTNALRGAKGDQDGDVVIRASMCPAGDTDRCVAGENFMPLALTLREDGEIIGGASTTQSIVIDEMVAGEQHDYTFDAHIEPGSATCAAVTGAAGGADWSSYSSFLVRFCVDSPFGERGKKGREQDDNCSTRLIKLALDPVASGDARSTERNKSWSKEVGNSVVKGNADFGTENRLDTSGIRTYTYATTGVGGWLRATIADAEVEAIANAAIVGSAVRTHIDVFGKRVYSRNESVPDSASRTIALSGDRSFSKSKCVTYNYGLAGVGFNATICAQGSAGVDYGSSVALTAQTQAPVARGVISGSVAPFVAMGLSARASLNAGGARGSVKGDLDLVDVSLPSGPTLSFEKAALDDTDLYVDWNVQTDLTVSFLNGKVTAWVDLLKPAWCKKKKKWFKIKYPCTKWKEVAKTVLVDFNGFRYAFPLISNSGRTTLSP